MEPDLDTSHMTREIHEMPQFIEQALTDRGLMQVYKARPPYQQNDYIGWIAQGKREDMRLKRLNQMLDELEAGGVYMRMKWNGEAGR